jgi:hypothetical protein
MQEGIQLPELMKKIKAPREDGLRAEHVAFSFMKRRVQPLMARDTLKYSTQATRTHRGCLATELMTMILSRGWKDIQGHFPINSLLSLRVLRDSSAEQG